MTLRFLPPPTAACPDGCGDFCPPPSIVASIPHLSFPRETAGALLIPKAGARSAPTIADEGPARRLLRELLDHADVIATAPDGGTFLLVDLPGYALTELASFDAEREDLENDDAAEDADATEDGDPAEDDDVDEDSDGQEDDGRHAILCEPELTAEDEAIRQRLRRHARSGRHAHAAAPTHPVLGVYRRIGGR
jgi:hypothetical protein